MTKWLGQAALSVAVLALVAWAVVDEWPDLSDWQRAFDGPSLVAAGALWLAMMTTILLRGLRWVALLGGTVPLPATRLLLGAGWCQMLLNLMPLRAGEAAAPLWVKLHGGSAGYAVGAAMIERVLDFLSVVLMVGLVALVWEGQDNPWRHVGAGWIGVVVALYLGLALWGRRLGRVMAPRLGDWGRRGALRAKIAGAATSVLDGLLAISDFRRHRLVLALTALSWLVSLAGFHVYLSTLLPDLPLAASLLALAFVSLANVIAVVPTNVGLFQAAGLLALTGFGVAAAPSLVAATGLHLVATVAVVVYGLTCHVLLMPGRA